MTAGPLGASYELVELIGRGSTGEVWRGTDRRTGEVVAAKLLHAEHAGDDELVRRFVRERTILLALRDENVVTVRDLVVDGDRLAVVMEHVGGGTMGAALADGGPLPPAVAFLAVAAVLEGLAAAHDRGVLHRDVKPDNVLLVPAWHDLRPGAVKLSDFGVAEILAEPSGPLVDEVADLVGTPDYLAPELLVTGALDRPVDVYAAGISLYELLGGRTPFAGPGTGYEVARRHVTSEVPRLPLPDALWETVAAMVAKDPGARPTARQAAVDLRRLAPTVAGSAALRAQDAPADLHSALGATTEVRGLTPSALDDDAAVDVPAAALPDLGVSGRATLIRSMRLPSGLAAEASDSPPESARPIRRRRGSRGRA